MMIRISLGIYGRKLLLKAPSAVASVVPLKHALSVDNSRAGGERV
jgi:hypothetical protein